jgi:hypothetical protein
MRESDTYHTYKNRQMYETEGIRESRTVPIWHGLRAGSADGVHWRERDYWLSTKQIAFSPQRRFVFDYSQIALFGTRFFFLGIHTSMGIVGANTTMRRYREQQIDVVDPPLYPSVPCRRPKDRP